MMDYSLMTFNDFLADPGVLLIKQKQEGSLAVAF